MFLRRLRIVLFSCCAFLAVSLAHAQQSATDEFELHFKVTSALLRAGDGMARLSENENLESASGIEAWHRNFEAIGRRAIEEDFRIMGAPTEKLPILRRALQAVRWKSVSEFALRRVKAIRGAARTSGIRKITTVVLTYTVLGYVFPPLIMKLGFPTLGIILHFSPTNIFAIGLERLMSSFGHRKRLAKLFGEASEFLEYRKLEQSIARELKAYSPKNFYIPVERVAEGESEAQALTILRKNPWYRRMVESLGLARPKGLTLKELESFLEQNGPTDAWTTEILKASTSDEIKAALIVQHMFEGEDEVVLAAFRERYAGYFVRARGLESWPILSEWVRKITHAQSSQQIYSLITEIPEQARAREVLTLWEQVVLPELVQREKLFSFSEYRSLFEKMHALKAELLIKKGSSVRDLRTELKAYFLDSMNGKSAGECFNSPEQVLMSLIRSGR